MTKKQALNLKLNDKVICKKSFNDYLPEKGWYGRVIYKNIKDDELNIGIEWEKKFICGHSCDTKGKDYHCRYYGYFHNESNINDNSANDADIYILGLINEQLEFDF